MPLFRVADDEVQRVLAMTVRPHPRRTFDDQEFLDLVARSYSIQPDEKVWIVENVHGFSQRDIDSLLTILRTERKGFESINRRFDEGITARMPVN